MSTIHYPRFSVCRINADGERIPVTSATITAYNVTAATSLSSTSSDSDGNVAAGTYTGTVGDIIRFGHATYPEYIFFTSTATAAEAYTHPDNIEICYVAENLATNTLTSEMVELYATDTDNPDVTPWKIGEGYSGDTVEIPLTSNVAKNLRIFPRTIDKKLGRVRQTFNITTGSQTVTIPSTDTIVSLDPAAWYGTRRNAADSAFETYDTRASRPLFEHYQTRTTTSTSEQTIHSFNVSRSQFSYNGDRILFNYTFITDSSAGEVYCRIKFAGTTIFDSGVLIDPGLGNSQVLTVSGWIARKNLTTARYSVQGVTTSTAAKDASSKQGEIASLDFYNTFAGSGGTAYDLAATIETPDNIGDASLTMAEARFVNATAAPIVTTSMWDYWEADSYSQSDGSNITTNWTGKYASKTATVSGTPTYETAELNGYPIIRLGADSNDYFTLPDMSALTAGHIFIVLKVTDVTTNAGNKLGSYASNDCYYPYEPDTPDGIYEAFGSTDRKSCGGSVATITSWHVLEMYSATNNWALYQNGQLLLNDTSHTVGFGTAPLIGSNGAAYMKADLFGVYIHSAKLSNANREKQYRYLAQKLGV